MINIKLKKKREKFCRSLYSCFSIIFKKRGCFLISHELQEIEE